MSAKQRRRSGASAPAKPASSTRAAGRSDAKRPADVASAPASERPAPERTSDERPATAAAPPVEPGAGASAVAAPTSAAPTPMLGRWLPWALVALLTAACVILATLYGDARQRVRELEHPAAATTATASGSPTPNAAAISAAPTTGPSAQQLLALQRRQQADQLSLGKVDAPIVLIEWADFRCPYCAAWNQQTLPQLIPYIKSGSLRVEFHDLVIFGDQSTAAARAARAAGIQGHFWDYSQQLWALHTGNGHPELSDQLLQDLAAKAGVVDVAQFNTDRNAQATLDAVNADTQQAMQMGLKTTPFFLINTTQIPGAYPAATFISVIEQYGGKPAQ